MKKFLKYFVIFLVGVAVVAVGGSFAMKYLKEPKVGAQWELGQGRTTTVNIATDGEVAIANMRDFVWAVDSDGVESAREQYINYHFNLRDIVGLKMGVSHFSSKSGIAHVFIVFDLRDGRDFGLSIESRRERGEEFTLLGGLKYDYELIYVLATEDDLLNLRKVRDEEIYLYPVKTTATKSQNLFRGLSGKINALNQQSEFYHLFARNCTNLIAREVAQISDRRFPFIAQTFLPGRAGEVLFDMGLINTTATTFAQTQEEFLVRF